MKFEKENATLFNILLYFSIFKEILHAKCSEKPIQTMHCWTAYKKCFHFHEKYFENYAAENAGTINQSANNIPIA